MRSVRHETIGRGPFPAVLMALGGAAVAAISAGFLTTPYMAVATFSYALLVAAVMVARTRSAPPVVHGILASSAVALDLGLVLILQLGRDAVGTVAQGKLSALEFVHVGSSTLAVVCFVPALILGWKAVRGGGNASLHRRFGKTAFLLRTVGFLTMFVLVDRVR